MCLKTNRSHTVCTILPPYILRQIAQNGQTPEQRANAARTLSIDSTFRALRSTLALSQLQPVPAIAGLAAPEGTKNRTISDARRTQTLPGDTVRVESGPAPVPEDNAVNEAFAGLGETFDFYWEKFDRNSIDGDGMRLNATVHFDTDYNNAFWNGQRMVFGDGDGVYFNRFTVSLDVIGHELTHGVTQDEGPLMYQFQSGALNESISDVFGSLIKQKVLNQTADKADWLIGKGLFTAKVHGEALRSMKAPGTAFDDPVLHKDPQPDHMNKYVHTFEDEGGVHINSGIPNRAFYLAATNIGGYAWEKAGRIWYEALLDPRLKPNTGFKRFARITVTNASSLYGAGGTEEKAIRDAWKQVGITIS
jgi:Zn-dependent metalloprotease